MRNTILQGDAWQLAKTLPDESINCIVTSPPYFGLRDYGTAQWEGGDPECDHVERTSAEVHRSSTLGPKRDGLKENNAAFVGLERKFRDTCGKCGATRIDQQFGLEDTPEEFVAKLVELFRELRRALRDDGTVWLNLGDSYHGSYVAESRVKQQRGDTLNPSHAQRKIDTRYFGNGLKPKDLVGIPWRVAFALQADGWYLRSEIIWHKKAPMPESVTDRPTKAHEQVFLLTKSPRYFYDAEAIREENAGKLPYGDKWNFKMNDEGAQGRHGSNSMFNGGSREDYIERYYTNGRNKRSVWTLGPETYRGAHFAVMPTKLVEPCILAGCPHKVCSECGAPWVRVVEHGEYNKKVARGQQAWTQVTGQRDSVGGLPLRPRATTGFAPTCACNAGTRPGVVLDPFLGSGTVAAVAKRLGRDWLGFELNPGYIDLAYERIDAVQPPLFEVTQ